jgi:hypothetical protein
LFSFILRYVSVRVSRTRTSLPLQGAFRKSISMTDVQ